MEFQIKKLDDLNKFGNLKQQKTKVVKYLQALDC